MNTDERIRMVQSMEFIMRNLNRWDDIAGWLTIGVADGDIDYMDFSMNDVVKKNLDSYIQDDYFADLMDTFCAIIRKTTNDGISGALYCDGIVSRPQ